MALLLSLAVRRATGVEPVYDGLAIGGMALVAYGVFRILREDD